MTGAAAGVAIAGGAVLGLAAPASAHNYLIASTPKIGSTLTALPKTFDITTNDRLLEIGGNDSGFAFRIVGPDGKYYEDGCVDVDGPSMTTRAALGASGKYEVEWQIVSADGHTVSDRYDFTWDAPAGFTPAKGSTEPPTCAADATDGASADASTTGTAAGGTASSASDALWIGAGGIVLVGLVVALLLLFRRRPAPAADEPDED